MPNVRGLVSTLALCAALSVRPASADIYTFTDPSGVVHFTNIEPKGAHRKKWKTLYKTGPGKASALRGRCTRCDVVPATDRAKDRYERYDAYIREAAELYQIPEVLIRAVIKVESDYDPRVVSSAGARGLMQLMPDVCKDMRVGNVHEPRENILGGTRLLRVLANRFQGDLVLTVAAYHAGAGAVRKYDAIPPYQTTQLYVRLVLRQYYRYKAEAAKMLRTSERAATP
jgi:soluble lytic murein transglycosylase-like protein